MSNTAADNYHEALQISFSESGDLHIRLSLELAQADELDWESELLKYTQTTTLNLSFLRSQSDEVQALLCTDLPALSLLQLSLVSEGYCAIVLPVALPPSLECIKTHRVFLLPHSRDVSYTQITRLDMLGSIEDEREDQDQAMRMWGAGNIPYLLCCCPFLRMLQLVNMTPPEYLWPESPVSDWIAFRPGAIRPPPPERMPDPRHIVLCSLEHIRVIDRPSAVEALFSHLRAFAFTSGQQDATLYLRINVKQQTLSATKDYTLGVYRLSYLFQVIHLDIVPTFVAQTTQFTIHFVDPGCMKLIGSHGLDRPCWEIDLDDCYVDKKVLVKTVVADLFGLIIPRLEDYRLRPEDCYPRPEWQRTTLQAIVIHDVLDALEHMGWAALLSALPQSLKRLSIGGELTTARFLAALRCHTRRKDNPPKLNIHLDELRLCANEVGGENLPTIRDIIDHSTDTNNLSATRVIINLPVLRQRATKVDRGAQTMPSPPSYVPLSVSGVGWELYAEYGSCACHR